MSVFRVWTLVITPTVEYAFFQTRTSHIQLNHHRIPASCTPVSTAPITTATMNTLMRDFEKQCEEGTIADERLQKEQDTRQMKSLMSSADTFKAGYQAKQSHHLFPTREELQAEAQLLKGKAAEKASGDVDTKTPQLNQPSKRSAEIEGNDLAFATNPGVENTSVKRLKLTASSSTSQTR